MNKKEKLIEIINNVIRCDKCGIVPEWLAEDLIFYGVTVQEWISVKDRLPDLELVEAKANDWDLYPCLATIKNDRAKDGRYVGKAWYDGKGFMDADCVDITYEVTHWMPLPQPPKVE